MSWLGIGEAKTRGPTPSGVLREHLRPMNKVVAGTGRAGTRPSMAVARCGMACSQEGWKNSNRQMPYCRVSHPCHDALANTAESDTWQRRKKV